MIKRILPIILMAFATVTYAKSPTETVNEVMQHYMGAHDVPGAAVILYIDGKPQAYYFGYANLETKQPITKDTIFELGSITKVMTSLLVAQEVDFAKIKLKDPITKYIPTLPKSFEGITVRSLATHTGGLPFQTPDAVKNRSDWEKYVQTMSPSEPVDTSYTYSQISIGLLGEAVEAVSHESFDQLYRSKILVPLGMQPIGLTVPAKLKPFYAQGYDAEGKPAAPISNAVFPQAGSMKASAEDMSKFMAAAIGLPSTPESIFYPIRMTETAYVAMNGVEQGLGWTIHDYSGEQAKALLMGQDNIGLKTVPVTAVINEPVFNGNELIDKTGATDGFRAYIAVIPDRKSGIIILTNRRDLSFDLMRAAREILFKTNGITA